MTSLPLGTIIEDEFCRACNLGRSTRDFRVAVCSESDEDDVEELDEDGDVLGLGRVLSDLLFIDAVPGKGDLVCRDVESAIFAGLELSV